MIKIDLGKANTKKGKGKVGELDENGMKMAKY